MLPHQSLDMEELGHQYPHLKGLPIDSYHDPRPRILIGMKHVQVSLVLKSREGNIGEPVAVKTRLGWIVCGGGNAEENETGNLVHYTFHVCSCERTSDDELHLTVKRHFALDSLGITKPEKLLLSTDDQRAQDLMKQLMESDIRLDCCGDTITFACQTTMQWHCDDINAYRNDLPMIQNCLRRCTG